MNITPEQNDLPVAAEANWWESFFASDTEIANSFRQGLLHAAYEAYRGAFGRLPGSARTSRLRKKRNTRVWNWYCDEYLPGQGTQPEAVCQSPTDGLPNGEYSIDKILDLAASFPAPNSASTE